MPPVCSNRQRLRLASSTSKRSATPGSHQTGSTAILVTETSPASWTMSPSTSSRPAAIAAWISPQGQPRLGDRDRRPDVDALGDQLAEILRHPVAPGIERDDLAGIAPLRMRPDLADRRGVVQVRPRLAGPSPPTRSPARGRSNRSRHGRRSRCGRRATLTVAITGPRSAAVGAPQFSGNRAGPREPGCDVSLIWPLFPRASSIFPFASCGSRPRADATTAGAGWLGR